MGNSHDRKADLPTPESPSSSTGTTDDSAIVSISAMVKEACNQMSWVVSHLDISLLMPSGGLSIGSEQPQPLVLMSERP